ncbi:capsule assembly Wzi family protein [Thalassotalea profundi]|uniref:Capsule assembly Wzi family protein n=1 Tax=Thalassotalea profundi TaxID=2036687 RepID=A0ABQ3II20_9GAMM|nr:capsule assembly Wzi family protein [Thalassotalea profundi]GHE84240.1 hypothetical protein GCM10011501_11040 [Thalassotalea profundi]
MLKKFIIITILVTSVVFSNKGVTNGVSPYLPLNIDPLIELEIARLVSIAKIPNVIKPYPIVTIVKALPLIEDSHPLLFRRLTAYIKRYKKSTANTHFAATLSKGFEKEKLIANKRGTNSDSLFQVSFANFYQANSYLIFNAGGSYIEGEGFNPHHSYVSFGYEYAQVDIGYREHWYSPTIMSAPLISTNAESMPSITVSNITPITDFNFKYELSFGKFKTMDGILYQGKRTSGKPGFLTMHLSAQPFSWWTIGANRILMFAGGQRSISGNDIWQAIIDPVNSDNCGSGETGCADSNQEVGNQIASITNKFDFSLYQMPISFMFELAGEDTKGHKNTQLGNVSLNFALFLPYLTQSTSLYVETANYDTHWYVHHIYDNAFRNSGNVMGHWWANEKNNKDISGASLASAKLNWDINGISHLEIQVKTIKIRTDDPLQQHRHKEIEFNYKHAYKAGFIGFTIGAGQDTLGDNFSRVAINYTW